uniref:Uncharacterized protein n=1 Tax=Oryza rufipogon TaxID=4529 RepID=A0A0E0PP61_ORYRU
MSERATEPGSRFSFAAMVDSSSWNGVLLTKSTKKGALKTILPLYEKAQPQLAGPGDVDVEMGTDPCRKLPKVPNLSWQRTTEIDVEGKIPASNFVTDHFIQEEKEMAVTYSVVTLPLVHMMPSHPPPQGSPEFQLNG